MPTRLLLGVVAAAALAAPSAASAQLPAGPLTAQGVEFVTNVAKHNDSAGARLHEGFFYITTERDLTIYDVSVPEAPKEVGHLQFPATAAKDYYFSEEDPDTNGEILITSNEGAVEVIDVRDKTKPVFLSTLAGDAQHTITCVLDCTWAYGSEGSVIDLRDPANPRLAGDWQLGRRIVSQHDVTEVAPGIVLTSTQPMHLLDARTDPAHPTPLATIANEDERFNHANLWPNAMSDQLVLVGGESVGPSCASDAAAAFQTYDASNWRETGTMRLLDEFRLDTGLLADGRMVDSTYCVHWFTTHPTYRNGGLVAIAWYEHGTRFLQVGRDGQVTEVGWFLPLGTTASAAYWITDRILYVTDYTRGLDVLKFTGEIAPGAPEGSPTAPPPPPPPPASGGAAPANAPKTAGSSAGQGAASLARPAAIAAARRRAARALGAPARFHRQLGSALVFRPRGALRVARRLRPVAVSCTARCLVRTRMTLVVGGRRFRAGKHARPIRARRVAAIRATLAPRLLARVRRAGGAHIATTLTVIDAAGRHTAVVRTALRG